MTETCLSIPRLAKHFGVPRIRVWRSASSGEIPSFRAGTLYRIKLSDVPEHVVEKWKRNGPPPKPSIGIEGDIVYFIAAENGPIKIGMSRDPLTRLARLNTSSPVRLSLVGVCAGGAAVERDYHFRFAAHRMNGEWFHPHPDILAEIERLNLTESPWLNQ